MSKYVKIRLFIVIITLILFLFSTDVLIFIDAKIHDKFILRQTLFKPSEKDKVYFSADSIYISQDLFNTLSIMGWSFVETKRKNDSRYVRFYLKSDKATYYVDTVLTWREIFTVFRNKNIVGKNHGFMTEFSTLTIKDGIYNIYLEDYENEENYGIVPIGKGLIKENGKVMIVPLFLTEKKEIIKFDIIDKKNIQYNIDIYKEDKINNLINIRGWAYLKDANKTGKIYVGVKDISGQETYYTTGLMERPDVVKHFNNNADLLNSGFQANIKLDNIENNKISSIIIEYNGKYYKNIIEPANTDINHRIDIDKDNIIQEEKLLYNIDKTDKGSNLINIRGWAYLKDEKKTGKIYVGLKDTSGQETYYTTGLMERPDVVKHFNNADLLNSGFQASIKLDNIENYKISSIIIEYNGKYYKKIIEPANTDIIHPIDIDKDKMIQEGKLLYNIDKTDKGSNLINIRGWAYLKDEKKTGKIYVGLKDTSGQETYYTTGLMERPDVVKHFNNADLLNSGFKVSIKLDNIKNYKISSIIIEYNSKYYKKAIK